MVHILDFSLFLYLPSIQSMPARLAVNQSHVRKIYYSSETIDRASAHTRTARTTGNKQDEIYATVNVVQKLNFSTLWAKLSDSHVILEIVQPI